jgi:hypothetical protein
LIEIPKVITFDSFGFFWEYWLYVGVELVVVDGLKKIIDGSFDLYILTDEIFSFVEM